MIAIALRTDENISYFRRNLISILSYQSFTQVIICSGYFQENYDGGTYQILNNGILSTILANPNYANIEYIIVGGKFSSPTDKWKISFNKFLSGLKSNRIKFKAFVDPNGKWHAKIAVGIENKIPKTVLIGSSNMSRPAFDEPYRFFNIEADILLLANESKLKNHFNLEETANQNPLSQIVADLSPGVDQANLESRIRAISDEFFNGDLLEEYNDFE